MDKYNVDSHKLMYHPKKVSDWLDNKNVYPIYLEISPTGSCNHRCKFCCIDFLGYKPIFLEKDIFEKRITEMSKLGIKSIMFGGEGEPLLHKNISDMINHTKSIGIDVSLTTNGVLLTKEFTDKCLKNLSWIKISCAAGTKETHSKIHKANIKDFDKILDNLKYAIKVKKENNYKVVIGMQFILLSDNEDEVEILVKKIKKIGLNYLVIKPYAQNLHRTSHEYDNMDYEKYFYLSKELEKYDDENFNIIFRIDSMDKWNKKYHGYGKCLSLPFSAYINPSGNVRVCCAVLSDKKFYYGNIYENTFEEIWNSKKRKEVLEYIDTKLNIDECQLNCRMDKMNKYLWDLKHPIEHVNFI